MSLKYGGSLPELAARLQEASFEHDLEAIEGGREFKKMLENRTTDMAFRHSSALKRFNSFLVTKYLYPMASTYTVLCHRVRSANRYRSKRFFAVYAYSYWRQGASEPEYVCYGPTYTSQDGEYRKSFVHWEDFERIYTSKEPKEAADFIDSLEKWVYDALEDDLGAMDTTVYPNHEEESRRVVSRSDELRISLRLYVAEVATTAPGTIGAVHENPTLREVKENMIDSMSFKFPELNMEIKNHLKTLRTGSTKRALQIGQKIIPVSLMDATRSGDLRGAVWRELWISRRLSDTVINNKCEQFPIYNQWTEIRGATPMLYENEAMEELYMMSTAAVKALQHLEVARRTALAAENGLGSRPRMLELDRAIHRGETFAESHIILSNLAVVVTSEYTGNTLGTIAKNSKRLALAKPTRGADNWLKAAFDLVYGCIVMHQSCCHADLHMNNATVYFSSDHARTCAHKLYLASDKGERDAFVVPVPGVTAKIIDFSRSILNPELESELLQESGADQIRQLYRDQAEDILAAAHRWMPGFTKINQTAIKGAALSHPQRAYNAICAVDFLAVARNMLALFEKSGADFEIGVDTHKAYAVLEREAERELLHRLKLLVDGKDVPPASEAGVVLLHALAPRWSFAKWHLDEANAGVQIVDMLVATAPMKYSSDHPNTFPPYTRPVEMLRLSPGKKLTDIISRGDSAILNTLADRQSGADAEALMLEIERERKKLSSEASPDARGSWLV